MVADKLATLKHGDNQHTAGDANLHVLTRADAAASKTSPAAAPGSSFLGWKPTPPPT